MRIEIKTIPHEAQPYDTCGDWRFDPKVLDITVSSLGNEDEEFCVAIHEMIEAWLCRKSGVTQGRVDKWDTAHLSSDDPGLEPGCPYGDQHLFAECIERLVAKELGVDWRDYEEKIRNL